MKRERFKSKKAKAGQKSAGQSQASSQLKSGMTVDELKSLTQQRLFRSRKSPQGAPSSGLRPGMSVEELKRLTDIRLTDASSAGAHDSLPAHAASDGDSAKAAQDRARIEAEVQRVRAYIAAGHSAAESQGKATKMTESSSTVAAAAAASMEPSRYDDHT